MQNLLSDLLTVNTAWFQNWGRVLGSEKISLLTTKLATAKRKCTRGTQKITKKNELEKTYCTSKPEPTGPIV